VGNYRSLKDGWMGNGDKTKREREREGKRPTTNSIMEERKKKVFSISISEGGDLLSPSLSLSLLN
jgi:hypothetical protein